MMNNKAVPTGSKLVTPVKTQVDYISSPTSSLATMKTKVPGKPYLRYTYERVPDPRAGKLSGWKIVDNPTYAVEQAEAAANGAMHVSPFWPLKPYSDDAEYQGE